MFTAIWCFAQGSIMLVGGGAESDASYAWSNTPYQWAVDQSTNKKVAVISYDHSGSDDWIPNYFESLGATEATNIEIASRSDADLMATYDLLMEYDVLFFKGGDQSIYYEYYKNTKVTDAITDKFNEDGVIAGTSAGLAVLSDVIFSAEGGAVYPDQVLANLNDEDITLRNDFVSILSGTLADSHFIERGRFGRLLGFLGKWYLENDEMLLGIGVDDRTAVCIAEGTATVYGTGAASFYAATSFSSDESRPVANGIKSTQVIHGHQYDLTTKSLTTSYTTNSSALQEEETGNYQLFLSGDGTLSHNEAMLSEFAQQVSEPLILITESETSTVTSFLDHLEQEGISNIELVTTNPNIDPCDQVTLRNTIRISTSFLFVENDPDQLLGFLEEHETGLAISDQLKRNGNVIAIVGQDAKLAGSLYCTNNLGDALNAYYGELAFSEGLGLLETTIVMPHTFSTEYSDFYENNSAAVLWEMIDQKLGYGLYLNENSFAHFYQEEGINYLTSTGDYSSVLVSNTSTMGGVADQQVNSSGDIRQVVGFDEMEYALISGQSIEMGNTVSSTDSDPVFELLPATNFQATRQETSIELVWDAIEDDNREGFRIYKKSPGSGFSLLIETEPDATSYQDTDVDDSSNYTYYLVAFNQNETSCRTEEVGVSVVTGIRNTDDLLHPNPVVSNQVITYEKNGEILGARIISLEGKDCGSLKNLGEQRMLIPNIKEGLYLLRIDFNDRSEVLKIIIK